jgi:hypothetical protein
LLVAGNNVIAVEIHQDSLSSSDISFDFELNATLGVVTPTAPAAPSGLAASPVSQTQINLTWTDNASNETGFIVERSVNGTDGWAQVGTPPQNATGFSDATAAAGSTYYYRVRATNGVGPSADSNVANATTPAVPTAPAAPSNLVASPGSPTQINLTWTDNANNETGFIVERSPNGVDGWTPIATPAQNAAGYNDTTVVASTQYFYRVRATNGVGPSADSNVANATTPAAPTAPAAPSALVASAASASQINLTWTDNAGNETGFVIERSPNGIDGWTQVGTTAADVTSFSDTIGLSPSTQYFYRVRATNDVGPSADSNIASATTATAPTNPTVIAAGSVWKYLDNGSDQGTAWRSPVFDDATWKSGAAQLGYGDGDEATVVSFGGNTTNKYVTTYFRKTFTIDNAAAVTQLAMRLIRDDGVVIYLNGTQVYKNNMPTGAIASTTFASSTISGAGETTWLTANLSLAALVTGTNTIAVEMHQDSAFSSDISFDMELKATLTAPASRVALAAMSVQPPKTTATTAFPEKLIDGLL